MMVVAAPGWTANYGTTKVV